MKGVGSVLAWRCMTVAVVTEDILRGRFEDCNFHFHDSRYVTAGTKSGFEAIVAQLIT